MRNFALVAGVMFAASTSVTPVQKVIQLLGDMEAKCKKEKSQEEVEFAKFSQFCTDKQATTKTSITKANRLIEDLTASIGKAVSDVQTLSDEIAELNGNIADNSAAIKEAKTQRVKDHDANTDTIEDYLESEDALQRAIVVISEQKDRAGTGTALLQLSLPEQAQHAVQAFIGMDQDFLTQDAPEANAYEVQSGGVLEMLKKLYDEFRKKRSEAQKAEMNCKHASSMVVQDLTDQIENDGSSIAAKTETKETKKQKMAEQKKRLAATTSDRDEDVATLTDLETECFQKDQSFKEKQELRAQEIKAIAKAIEIMSSDDVAGNAEKHLPSALQTAKSSLAQLRSSSQSPDSRRTAVDFLRRQGIRLHSQGLSMIVQKATSDPFAKVKKLIDAMIIKLIAEAGDESEQKGFCDKELGTSKITRNKLTENIDGMQAKIDDNDASLIEISSTLSRTTKEISEIQTAMQESTELRNGEKSKNTKTIKDADAAQEACKAALAILKDFYAKAGEATAFIQTASKKGPFDVESRPKMGTEEWKALANPNYEEQAAAGGDVDKGHTADMQTFGDTYQGASSEAGGVLAMMEVIMSDFASLEADTTAGETEAVKAYADFMAQSKKSVATKEKGVEMLTSDQTELQSQMIQDKKDLANTQDQLLAADRYYDKLKPQCVDSGITYDERVTRRNDEIVSLKEALKILEGGAIA